MLDGLLEHSPAEHVRRPKIAARHADPRTTMRSTRSGPHQPGPAPELHPGRLHVLSNLTSPRLPGSSSGETPYIAEKSTHASLWQKNNTSNGMGLDDC